MKTIKVLKPYDGPEKYIFISYAHKSKEKVIPLISKLQRDGYRVWFDEGIDPGIEWADDIAARIENCGCFLAVISKGYIQSENCRDELSYARENNLKIILVFMEDVVLPGGMDLRTHRRQRLYFYKYKNKSNFYDRLYMVEEVVCCNLTAETQEKEDCSSDCEDALEEINVKELENASMNNDAEATYELAECYECGLGVPEDKVKAFELYLLAEKQGSVMAKVDIGRSYKYGIGVKRDKKKSFRYFEDAALLGNAEALEYLAYEYDEGTNVTRDKVKALELLEKSYYVGNEEVAYLIGTYYFNGVWGKIKKDKKTAAEWFEKAVESGDTEFAAEQLAEMYLCGDGVAQDKEKAIKLLELDEGDDAGASQYKVGMMYFYGDGVLADKAKGIQWLKKSAEENEYPEAAAELGRIYEEGDGVTKDIKAAKEWYSEAAGSESSSLEILMKSNKGRIKIMRNGILDLVILVVGAFWGVRIIEKIEIPWWALGIVVGCGMAIGAIDIWRGQKMKQRFEQKPEEAAENSGVYGFLKRYRPIFYAVLYIIFSIMGMLMVGRIVFYIDDEISKQSLFMKVSQQKIGTMTYEVPTEWSHYNGDIEDEEITYEPYGRDRWDFINFYKRPYEGANGDIQFSDYEEILDSYTDIYSDVKKSLIAGVKGYRVDEVIEYKGVDYFEREHLLIHDGYLYIVRCSTENPPNEYFLSLYNAVVKTIQFEESLD